MSKEERNAKLDAQHNLQTEAFSSAIDFALKHTGKQFDCPLINSIAAAIVITEARLLASVPEEYREGLIRSMQDYRPEAYALHGPTVRVEILRRQEDGALQ